MKERIIAFLETINIGSTQFAEEIGVQPSGISHILSGRNNPSLDFVLKTLKRYPDLSTEWLLFGKGNMYRRSGNISEDSNIASSEDNNIASDIVKSESTPEYLSGLFAGIEGDKQISPHPADNKYNNGNGGNLTEENIAEKLILIYGDGTFEQLSLRRSSEKKPIQGSDK